MQKNVKKEALKFLSHNHSAALATAHNNRPYVSVIYYIVDKKFNFYFLTKRATDKYKNIALNSTVSLTIGFGPSLINVQAKGKAKILYGKEKIVGARTVRKVLNQKNINGWPIEELLRFKQETRELLKTDVLVKIIPYRLDFFNLENSDIHFKLI